jgi:hypothetical protein
MSDIKKAGSERTAAENLRARAAYIAEYGFSHRLAGPDMSCCFIGATEYHAPGARIGDELLKNVIFGGQEDWYASYLLERHGWTTEDAVAALNMAADIAECRGL